MNEFDVVKLALPRKCLPVRSETFIYASFERRKVLFVPTPGKSRFQKGKSYIGDVIYRPLSFL
jgi:hypothetical protein